MMLFSLLFLLVFFTLLVYVPTLILGGGKHVVQLNKEAPRPLELPPELVSELQDWLADESLLEAEKEGGEKEEGEKEGRSKGEYRQSELDTSRWLGITAESHEKRGREIARECAALGMTRSHLPSTHPLAHYLPTPTPTLPTPPRGGTGSITVQWNLQKRDEGNRSAQSQRGYAQDTHGFCALCGTTIQGASPCPSCLRTVSSEHRKDA